MKQYHLLYVSSSNHYYVLRSSVNVTFWDSFAVNFDKQMNEVSEKPVIVIIASSRVGLWNGNSNNNITFSMQSVFRYVFHFILHTNSTSYFIDEVDLSSVGGTICYLNYNHYSVFQLRKKYDF